MKQEPLQRIAVTIAEAATMTSLCQYTVRNQGWPVEGDARGTPSTDSCCRAGAIREGRLQMTAIRENTRYNSSLRCVCTTSAFAQEIRLLWTIAW